MGAFDGGAITSNGGVVLQPPSRIVLDLDSTYHPNYGEQEGRHFHACYDCYCDLPLYILCGRHLLAAKLRTSSVDAADGSVAEVARIVGQVRARWPRTSIVIRAGSGSCRDDTKSMLARYRYYERMEELTARRRRVQLFGSGCRRAKMLVRDTLRGAMSYVVIGFYTPNYAEIAAAFSQNLDQYSVPHNLYAVEMLGSAWQIQTLRKPEIILRALDEYPDKTVIFMDVDCSVQGDLSPLLEPGGDVAIYPLRNKKSGRLWASSRVVVCHQTPGARRLLAAWHEKCKVGISKTLAKNITSWRRHVAGSSDEVLLRRAIDENPGVVVTSLLASQSGHSGNPNALVKHDSAHDRFAWQDRLKNRVKQLRRAMVERIVGRPYKEWKYGIE